MGPPGLGGMSASCAMRDQATSFHSLFLLQLWGFFAPKRQMKFQNTGLTSDVQWPTIEFGE